MSPESKAIILRALDDARGDNYERATSAFRNCTPEQMQQHYGESGETRQSILDGYKRHVDAVNRAQREVEAS